MISSLVGSLTAAPRIWTSTNGVQIEGDVFEVQDQRVGIRIKGRDYYFLISRFQAKDQLYLKQWSSEGRCGACAKKLSGEFREAGDSKYHPECFRCLVCQKDFSGGDALGKDPWGGMVHLDHMSMAKSCSSCSRFFREEGAAKRQFFHDGRISCHSCMHDGVFDLLKLEQVKQRVLPILQRVGFEFDHKLIKLNLVDRSFLNREAKKIKTSGNLRGLTLTKYKISRGPGFSETSFEHRIYILFGLPYVECISVLAHEYAHVWLNERFIDSTPLEVEGFCNLVAELCLGQDKTKLSVLLRENMIKSENPVYGLGFRKMRSKLKNLGWNGLLAEMLAKASPP